MSHIMLKTYFIQFILINVCRIFCFLWIVSISRLFQMHFRHEIIHYIIHTYYSMEELILFSLLKRVINIIKILSSNLNIYIDSFRFIQTNQKRISPSNGNFSKGAFYPKLLKRSSACCFLTNLYFLQVYTNQLTELIFLSLVVCETVRVLFCLYFLNIF